MPVPDPRAGRAFVWLISFLLFVSVAVGGSFLIAYIFLGNEAPSWLPFAGVSLVCLPWLFWFLTFSYRIISRACGFRVAVGGGGVGGGGGRGIKAVGDVGGNVVALDDNENVESPRRGGDEMRVRFGAAVVVGEGDDGGGKGNDGKNPDSLSSNSSNDLSVTSHESEIPLASSMRS